MKINMRTDYSFLFNSLSGSSSNNSAGIGMSSFLSDYASIKNGSYGKLMKAYYGKNKVSDEVSSIANSKNNSVETATKKELAQVQTDSDALKESADALIAKGKDSLFKEKDIVTKDESGKEITTKGYDTDAIYKAVNTFVNDYNALIASSEEAGTSKITNGLNALTGTAQTYTKMLSKVGITVNDDKSLSLDEKAFKAADMTKVEDLFNTTGGFAYSVSAKSSMLNFYATSEANKMDTYNFNGNYSGNFSAGNLFNGYM